MRASLLGLLFLFAMGQTRAADQPAVESYKLLYLADPGIVVIEVFVTIDGSGPRARFDKYVESLMTSFDKNNDGTVAVDELRGRLLSSRDAAQLQMIPADTAVSEVSPDISPKDGKVSLSELNAYFKRIGLSALFVKAVSRSAEVNPETGMANQPGDVPLFEILDTNRDQKLSGGELANALEVLRKLDRDDDQTISVAELQPLATPNRGGASMAMNNRSQPASPFVSLASGESLPKLIRRLVNKYDSDDPAKSGTPASSTRNQKLSRHELGISESEFQKYDVDGDTQLDSTELRAFVTSPETTVRLQIDLSAGKVEPLGDANSMMRTTHDGSAHLQFGAVLISVSAMAPGGAIDAETFIKPLFMALDQDLNGYLEKSEAPDDALYGASFGELDLDKNGKAYLEEVVDYFKVRMEAARHRVELSISEQGRTLFDILDSDRDGRLAHRELRNVSDKLFLWDKNRDEQLSPDEIPIQFQIVVAEGSIFNLSALARRGSGPRASVTGRTAGPVWFRKMDRNSDGEISRREFLGDLDLFEKLDLNHDGALELNEALQVKSD